ncbi:MAG: YqgE/AlgH family protein [Nitrospirota bacterium]
MRLSQFHRLLIGAIAAALLVSVVAGDSGHAASETVELGKGLFLIAELDLRDPNFSETVILITHHSAQGTTGVVINRPTATALSEALPDRKELAGRSDVVHAGGPVGRRALQLLLRTRTRPEHAQHVFGDVYVTQAADVLLDALTSDDAATAIRLFAGYAGWAPGQLADEIARGSWRVVPAEAAVLFDRDPEVIWKEMIRRTSEQFI